MDKKTTITGMIRPDGLGLEIGPSFNPLLPKREGHRIRTMDHATREELVAKYQAHGLPQHQIDAIEEVDYVWRGQPLAEIVGATRFDYVIASHVVEHTTDFVGFLNDCASILAPDGVLCLVVPDKRFCFDRFRPLTSLGQVVETHLDPRMARVLTPIVDVYAYTAYRHGVEPTWSARATDGPQLITKDWQEVREALKWVTKSEEYIDIHRWTFTPASFELLIHDLVQLGMIELEIDTISETNEFEFYVGLVRGETGAPPDSQPNAEFRLNLLLEIEREQLGIGAREGLSRAEAELAAVHASTSWRVTAPLRRLSDRFRRLAR